MPQCANNTPEPEPGCITNYLATGRFFSSVSRTTVQPKWKRLGDILETNSVLHSFVYAIRYQKAKSTHIYIILIKTIFEHDRCIYVNFDFQV